MTTIVSGGKDDVGEDDVRMLFVEDPESVFAAGGG
jgi:hypothetical protein